MDWRNFKTWLAVGMVSATMLVLNCVKYSFKGALPSYIKSIYIAGFEDRSDWPGVRENLVQKLIDAFVEDNTLDVVEKEENADLVLQGVITSIQRKAVAITEQEQVDQYELRMNVQVNCLNRHTNQSLWRGSVSQGQIIPADATLEDMNTTIDGLIDQIVQDIVVKTIAAW